MTMTRSDTRLPELGRKLLATYAKPDELFAKASDDYEPQPVGNGSHGAVLLNWF